MTELLIHGTCMVFMSQHACIMSHADTAVRQSTCHLEQAIFARSLEHCYFVGNHSDHGATDSPESQLEIGAGGTDVYIMSGVNTPAATQQPVSQAAVSGEPCAPAREPKALPVVVPPSDPAPAAVTNGGAHVGRSKTAGDGVVDITAALAGAHIRETQAVNPGGSRAVTAVGIPSEQSGSAVVIPPAGTGDAEPKIHELLSRLWACRRCDAARKAWRHTARRTLVAMGFVTWACASQGSALMRRVRSLSGRSQVGGDGPGPCRRRSARPSAT